MYVFFLCATFSSKKCTVYFLNNPSYLITLNKAKMIFQQKVIKVGSYIKTSPDVRGKHCVNVQCVVGFFLMGGGGVTCSSPKIG